MQTLPYIRYDLNSSAIRYADHYPDSGRLEIAFKGGSTRYTFHRVPESVVAGLVNSSSVGKYYAQNIRGHYQS